MSTVLSKLRGWTPFFPHPEKQGAHTLPERPAAEPHPSAAFREIVVAIDYAAHPALQVAIALASSTLAHLTVLHVAPTDASAIQGEGGGERGPAMRHEDPKHVLAVARAFVPENMSADYFVVEGDPSEEICKFISQIRPDLIVMGARRTEADDPLRCGATSRNTLLRCPCPLLLVPVSK